MNYMAVSLLLDVDIVALKKPRKESIRDDTNTERKSVLKNEKYVFVL